MKLSAPPDFVMDKFTNSVDVDILTEQLLYIFIQLALINSIYIEHLSPLTSSTFEGIYGIIHGDNFEPDKYA